MSWEPDTEELRLGIARKEINDLKSQTSFSANPISVGSSSNAMGSNSGTASMNQGSNGDVVKDITNIVTTVSENSISWIVGAIDAVGSLFTVKPDPATTGTIEPTADCATIRTLSGGVDGQKITLKPEKNKKICLMHNPVTNTSAIGNLLLGGVDVTITDPEMITLRFTTEVGSLYKDSYLNNVLPIIPTPASPQTPPPVLLIPKGGWLIESIGEGNTIVGSNRVVKDPVKVATTGNNIAYPLWGSTIDGVGMVAGDRFLVKDQSNPNEKDNGIYIWALLGSTRSTDMASGSTQKEGTMTYIQDGNTEAERLYAINIGGNNITIGTSANTWGEIGSGGGGSTGSIKSPVKYSTTTNITLSGEQSIDGTTTVTNRVLVKDQTTSSENGIYVTATGAWARSTDMSTGSTIEGGTMVYVTDGTINGDNLFGLTTEGTVTVGTDVQAWANLTIGGANTALSNLALTTSINSDLTMQNGFSIANLERVAFNTRTSSSIAGSISYDGTDIFAKGSGAEVNLTVERANTTLSNLTSPTAINQHLNISGNNIVMGTGEISAGGSQKEINNIGELVFVDNTISPVGNGIIYFNGTDVKVKTGSSTVNLTHVGGANFTDAIFRVTDELDLTKKFAVDVGGNTTGMTATLGFAVTGNRTIMFPDATTILAGLSTTNIWSGINTFSTSIVAGGAGTGMNNIGELNFINNLSSPVGSVVLYSDGTDLFSNSSISLNGNDLKGVDDIFFSLSGKSINTDSVGMVLQVPTTETIDFLVNGSRMKLSETVLDIKVPTTMTTNGITFTTGNLTMGTGEIIAGGAGKEINNIGELVFVNNAISPVGNGLFYFNGSDIIAKTGNTTVNLTNVGGANFTDAIFRITDELDLTKKFAFDVGSISTGTVRTMTIPDADINMGGLTNSNLASGIFGSITGIGSQSQSLNMNANKITGVQNPSTLTDVVTLDYFNSTGDTQWLELDGTGTMTGNINVGNNNVNNVNAVNVVRSDGVARMVIQGGVSPTTQVLFDSATDVNIRFTEALVDRFEIQNSTNTIRSHVDLNMEGNNILNGSIDTGLIDSGILGITRGGTGNSTNTRGDILYSPIGNNWSRLPVGSANQVLTSDGTDVSWQNAGGGSQTPWTSNIDASTYNLTGLGYLRYNTSGVSTSGNQGMIWFDGYDDDFKASTATGLQYNLTENSHITWLEHETSQFDYDVFISNMPNGIVRTKNAGTGVVDTGGAIVSLTANRAYYIPFYIGKQCKIDEIGFLPFNNGMSSTATINYGIYRNRSSGTGTSVSVNPNQYYPETQVANGSFYVGSTNEEFKRKTAINQTVYKGWYWIGFNINQSGMQLYAQPYGGGQATSVGNFLNTFGNDTIRPIHGYFTTDSGSIDTTPDEEMTPIDGYAYPVPEIFIKLIS